MGIEQKVTRYLRQVIVVDASLSMPKGKLAAMVAHGAMTFLAKRLRDCAVDQYDPPNMAITGLSDDQIRWLTECDPGLTTQDQRSFAKIVVGVKSKDELLAVEKAAHEAGLECHRVTDCGYSHNKPGDIPCICIGPAWPEQLAPVTGHLDIYR